MRGLRGPNTTSRSLRSRSSAIVGRLLQPGQEETVALIRVTSSIMEAKPAVPRAILVGIQVPSVDDVAHAASIEELGRLVKTLGYEVVGTMSQKRDGIGGATVLGKGAALGTRGDHRRDGRRRIDGNPAKVEGPRAL